MVWFTNQSLLLIALAFLLGLLVGYLWWGLRLRRVRSTESSLDAAPLAATAPAAALAAAEPLATTPTASDPTPTEPEPSPEPTPEPVAATAAEPLSAADDAAPTETSTDAPAEPVAAEPQPAAAEPEPAVAEAEPVAAPAEVAAEPEPVAASADADEPIAAFAAEPVPAAAAVAEITDTVVDEALVAEVESAFAADAPAAQDELERIEGIGPKIAAALRAAGITTFAALADAERSTVEDALADANLRFAPSLGTWARQARLLADGDEAGFKELTDRLIAGREVTDKPSPNGATAQDLDTDQPADSDEAPSTAAEPVAEDAEAAAEDTEAAAEDAEAVTQDATAAAQDAEAAVEAVADDEAAATVDDEPEPVADAPAETPVGLEAASAVDAPAETPVDDEPAAAVVPAQASGEELPVDDLKRIEGIGPKMSAALVAAGIRTFSQLAASDVDTLRTAIEAAGLRFAPSIVTWARQAQLLANGDEEGFADLTRRLVAGRDTGRS
ncbi:helix-hairpin-helix domain-containing protein [Dactylosporangium sp. AC04546]|uniref:helix-hairpin-helix domain-containing protein n=1 Tax=Dactylosporangium sp. AC04546 TaxID=2862460 RepID=UPI001EDD993A|nr:helix-hairpin-helix domain-containing protein [Dactylosporangium sp. AC04546]WVK83696.1 helix-hairpin-helix domain-containing protein [Dactylosporangium sp. AC04546]